MTPNNFQIINQHLQIIPNFSNIGYMRPKQANAYSIQLLKFSPGAY